MPQFHQIKPDSYFNLENNMVVDPSVVLEDVSKYKLDQVAVFARVGDEVAAWSSHPAEDMEDLINDVEDALNNDTIMDPIDDEE